MLGRLSLLSFFLLHIQTPQHASAGKRPRDALPPPDVQATANESTITLTFHRPANSSPLTISYRTILSSPRGVNEIRTIHVSSVPGSVTSTFKDLSPGTVYSLLVTAEYGQGSSSPLLVFVKTLDLLQRPSAPTLAKATNVSSLFDRRVAVWLEWLPPPPSRPQGDLLIRYEVVIRNRQTKRVRSVSVPSNVTALLVDDLSPYTDYVARVRAYNVMGSGKFSQKMTFLTEEGVPEMPRNFSVVLIDGNSVDFSWSPPSESNGVLENYVLDCVAVYTASDGAYRPVQNQPILPFRNKSVSPTSHFLHVEGLQEETLYSAFLWARNCHQDGSKNVITFRTTQVYHTTASPILTLSFESFPPSNKAITKASSNGLGQMKTVIVGGGFLVALLVVLSAAIAYRRIWFKRKYAVSDRESRTIPNTAAFPTV
eukprot:m.310166 g.310166  ORF g.310166 m.310166 type:complete len:426 (+) comp50018_c0_seq1:109-1386(+)